MIRLEFELDEIRAVLDKLPPARGTVTDQARDPFLSAIEKLEEALPSSDDVVERFLDGFRSGIARAEARRMSPRWEWLKPAIAVIDRTVKSDPAYVHNADAIGATVRDTFDALGLSIRDPETIYVALVTASELVELCSNGYQRGKVTTETLEAVAQIAQSFAAAMIPYLPDEAKP